VVTDHNVLFGDPEIEAIVISAPRPATGPLTLAALNAGKHVLAEKPMAHSVEQAEQLVEMAESRGLIYAIGYMKRYDPGVQATRLLFDEVVAQGRLGRLLLARFYDFSSAYAVPPPPHVRPRESRTERFPTWPPYPSWLPEQHRGLFAWFLNAASHDVNLLHFFFPRGLEVISAHCGGDTSVVATMRQGDASVVLEVAKAAVGTWLEGIDFLFERGRISVVIPSPMATDSVSQVIVDDPARGIRDESMRVEPGWSFARQARGFVDALVGTATPMTSGKDGLADMVLTEEIWRHAAA
jgi:predicted dehydrogenase